MSALVPLDAAAPPVSPRASRPAIEVRELSHSFGGERPVEVLRDVSIEVATGAFASIIGRSGCGKSTLLRVLAGVLEPSEGEARIDGASVLERPGAAAFMPQRDTLLPWRRVRGNATLGAEVGGMARAEAEARAAELFPRFGLAGFEDAWPAELSGGMRQRLALLRTFLTPGGALLLDEPFGALDALTRREMHAWLQDVWEADRRPVLLVTHDIDEAIVLSDVIYVLSDRPGRVIERIEVSLARPRRMQDATAPEAVAAKARVLAALERGEREPSA